MAISTLGAALNAARARRAGLIYHLPRAARVECSTVWCPRGDSLRLRHALHVVCDAVPSNLSVRQRRGAV